MKTSLDDLNAMAPAAFCAAVGETFERAPWVAEKAAALRPFESVIGLHAAMMGVVQAAPPETRLEFVRAHPDLAGKAARAGDITDDSRREQASVGLDTLSDAEFERFQIGRAHV